MKTNPGILNAKKGDRIKLCSTRGHYETIQLNYIVWNISGDEPYELVGLNGIHVRWANVYTYYIEEENTNDVRKTSVAQPKDS